jgi:DNA polymerase-3 subunit delta'
MAFADFDPLPPGVARLQRSLERGRLGHAYLFGGDRLDPLEDYARTLAKTLNCHTPPRRAANGLPLDCCDACPACRKIDRDLHPDVRWLRPESKLRVILVDQIRSLLEALYLKPTEGSHKVAVIVAADRLNVQAANAFLKTLEEPPAGCVLLLLTTEPARVLETIQSRCLRVDFGADRARPADPALVAWLRAFSEQVAAAQGGLLARYRLLDQVLTILASKRAAIEQDLKARSPLERYDDVEPALRDQWEVELAAAVEAEYRRQRGDLLAALQWWLRDVWLAAQGLGEGRLGLPELVASTDAVARRLNPQAAAGNLQALERTQRLLAGTNVQEALALEVGLLKLQL